MDSKFVNGLKPRKPQKNRPDWVIGKASIHVQRMKEFLEEQTEEWINIDMFISKKGNPVAVIDEWRPDQEENEAPANTEAIPPQDDDIPW